MGIWWKHAAFRVPTGCGIQEMIIIVHVLVQGNLPIIQEVLEINAFALVSAYFTVVEITFGHWTFALSAQSFPCAADQLFPH